MTALAAVDTWPYCDVAFRETPKGLQAVPGDTWPKESPEGAVWYRSETLYEKGSAADFANAKQQFRFRAEEEWVELFDRAPHIIAQLLGDLYRETIAERERDSGKARIGRRPKVVAGSLEELWEILTPRYSMEPFAVSARELISAAPSLRAFAKRAGIHHHTITRMMRGEVALDRFRLEQIAKAGRVHPVFFMEYREMLICESVLSLLRQRPNVGIRVVKQIQRGRM